MIAVAACLDHLVELEAQAAIVQRPAQEHQDAMVNSRMGRYNPKAPVPESFEVGDWVLLQWEGERNPVWFFFPMGEVR